MDEWDNDGTRRELNQVRTRDKGLNMQYGLGFYIYAELAISRSNI